MKRRGFKSKMPVRPIRQKHADNPKTGNNFGFWRSLGVNDGVDVDLRVVWNDPAHHDKAHGCLLYCMHNDTPAGEGYRWIVREDGKCHPMSDAELHRPLAKWTPGQVNRWRRGQSKNSARPRTQRMMLRYLRRNGGTAIMELKSREFRVKWIMQQAVQVCFEEDSPPWFKALSNMAYIQQKAEATLAAQVDGRSGDFAVIFGKHVTGRGARDAHGQAIIRTWPPETRENVRIW